MSLRARTPSCCSIAPDKRQVSSSGLENITPIFLPSRALELNPVENIWQYLRQNWLANTVFENYDAIVDAACDAVAKAHRLPRTDHIHWNAKNGQTSVDPHDRWNKASPRSVQSYPRHADN